MQKITILLIFATAIFATSCNKNKVYEQRNDIAMLNWATEDVQNFEVEIPAEATKIKLKALVRYASNCPVQDLPLHVSVVLPNGSNLEQDCSVAIKKDGKNQGNGLGDLWDNETLIVENTAVTAGTMKVKIGHKWEKNKAPLIMKIGLFVEKQ